MPESRSVRSPEVYALMKKFTEGLTNSCRTMNSQPLSNSPNSFSRFKKALADYPAPQKKWFALNAGAMKKTITEWH